MLVSFKSLDMNGNGDLIAKKKLNHHKQLINQHTYVDTNLQHTELSMGSLQISNNQSPRRSSRGRLLPHIKICDPDSRDVTSLQQDDLDNEVFETPRVREPSPTRTFASDEKHEVYSGRLYLLRHTGSGGTSPGIPPSPKKTVYHSTCSPRSPQLQPSSPTPQSPLSVSTSSNSFFGNQGTAVIRRTSVYVRVYRINLDHFALISRDVIYTSKPIYVNVRRCRLIPGHTLGTFILAGKQDSGELIEFETPDLSTLGQWLDALQSYTPPSSPSRGNLERGASSGSNSTPPVPRSPALPTLTEDEEDI